jgi:hypothetical protein
MHRVSWILGALLLLPLGVRAQTTTPDEREQELRDLRARVQKLEQLVEEMRAEKESRDGSPAGQPFDGQPQAASLLDSAKADPSGRAALPNHPSPQVELSHDAESGHDMGSGHEAESGHESGTFPSLHLRGFGNLNFSATNDPTTTSGFTLGQFILHVASPISRKVSVFGEISFTAAPTSYTLDVERYLIRYDLNDYFKLSFGRYHTPINYWNTAYHHGLWLQTTIDRPEMIRFGGRFQPVHFVGMLAEGVVPSGPLGLGYNVGVGNGRAGSIARAGDSGDINNGRAVVVSVFARPASLNGLQVGGAVYHDEITPVPALPGGPSFRELITSAHIVWTRGAPEFLTEFAHVRHENELTLNVFDSQAAYVQFGYRLPGIARKWKPYYRYEWSNISLSDPLFTVSDPTVAVRDLSGSTIGARYDIVSLAAFKVEYRHTARRPTDPVVNGLFLQTSFTF